MGKYDCFIIYDNHPPSHHGFVFNNKHYIKIDKPMYQDEFQKIIDEYKWFRNNSGLETDKFLLHLLNNYGIHADYIDLCAVEVNQPEGKPKTKQQLVK